MGPERVCWNPGTDPVKFQIKRFAQLIRLVIKNIYIIYLKHANEPKNKTTQTRVVVMVCVCSS